jgi:hypothetical protein
VTAEPAITSSWTPEAIRRRTHQQWADHHGTCPDCDHPAHPRRPCSTEHASFIGSYPCTCYRR